MPPSLPNSSREDSPRSPSKSGRSPKPIRGKPRRGHTSKGSPARTLRRHPLFTPIVTSLFIVVLAIIGALISRRSSSALPPESASESLIRRVKEEAARVALETEKEALLAEAWNLAREADPVTTIPTQGGETAEMEDGEVVAEVRKTRTLEELKAELGDLWESDDLTRVLNEAYRAQ